MTDWTWAVALLLAAGLVSASAVGYVVVRWVGLRVARLRVDLRGWLDTRRRLREMSR